MVDTRTSATTSMLAAPWSSTNPSAVLVELDIFSGRPNPCWELDKPTAEALYRLISQLDTASGGPLDRPGLGYRGFIMRDGSGERRAYNGYVISPNRTVADPSARVERFLLDRLPVGLERLRSRVPLKD